MMITVFGNNSYVKALQQKETIEVLEKLKTAPGLNYGPISFPRFLEQYSPSEWVTRKIMALPLAACSLISSALNIGKFALACLGVLKIDKQYYSYCAFRSLQQFVGYFTLMINDAQGCYWLQTVEFNKKCDELAIIKKAEIDKVIFGIMYPADPRYHSAQEVETTKEKLLALDEASFAKQIPLFSEEHSTLLSERLKSFPPPKTEISPEIEKDSGEKKNENLEDTEKKTGPKPKKKSAPSSASTDESGRKKERKEGTDYPTRQSENKEGQGTPAKTTRSPKEQSSPPQNKERKESEKPSAAPKSAAADSSGSDQAKATPPHTSTPIPPPTTPKQTSSKKQETPFDDFFFSFTGFPAGHTIFFDIPRHAQHTQQGPQQQRFNNEQDFFNAFFASMAHNQRPHGSPTEGADHNAHQGHHQYAWSAPGSGPSPYADAYAQMPQAPKEPTKEEIRDNFFKLIDYKGDANNAGEIRTAYRKACLKAHPDKNPDDVEGAKVKFQELQDAHTAYEKSMGR